MRAAIVVCLGLAASCGGSTPPTPRPVAAPQASTDQDARDLATLTAARDELCGCATMDCLGKASAHHHDALELMRAHDRRRRRDRAIDATVADLVICIQSAAGGKLLASTPAPAPDLDRDREVERLRRAMAHPATGIAECDRLLRAAGEMMTCSKIPKRVADLQLGWMAGHVRGMPVDGPWPVLDGDRASLAERCRRNAEMLEHQGALVGCAPAPAP